MKVSGNFSKNKKSRRLQWEIYFSQTSVAKNYKDIYLSSGFAARNLSIIFVPSISFSCM